MNGIEYQLIRSSRRTICISIRDNRVIVRAPLHTSVEKIEGFINKKRNWILKQLSLGDGYTCLRSYQQILIKGKMVALVLGGENKVENGCVTVKNLSCLNKLYVRTFGGEFLKIFDDVCQASGLNAKSVSFRSYNARWGCCDAEKRIIFNFKLLMLPEDLWRCVIVHELCHTVFMDHSKNFKMLANSIMPNYNAAHKELKKFSAVTRLY